MTAKRRPRARPRGRQPTPTEREAVRAAIGDRPLERGELIERLHDLQDHFGHLHAGHIAALAELLGLAQVEVYETASFYAHFDIIREGDSPPPPAVRLCIGPACRMSGAEALLDEALKALGRDVRVIAAPCQGACDTPPSAMEKQNRIPSATLDRLTNPPAPPAPAPCPPPSDPGAIDLEDAIERLEHAGLCGLGGAGFPVAKKWGFFKDAPTDGRVLIVNADEGEPGTFKDRHLLENHMQQVLDGALIAARALSASDVFIYLRDEYPHLHHRLKPVLAQIDLPDLRFHLRRGAGAYVCGEETALIESLEGKRGLPRIRPPYPAQAGYRGRPTITHNVETLFWIADIWARGAQAYADENRPRFYSVSGRVKTPGVYRAPSTTTARELIAMAGGLADGHALRAFLPGGASGGIFPERFADRAMDFGAFDDLGGFVGSGALIVLSQHDDVWDVARALTDFFAHESCGQCTPCRAGTAKMAELLNDPHANTAAIRALSDTMREASICGLGQAAPNPVLCALNHFEGDDA